MRAVRTKVWRLFHPPPTIPQGTRHTSLGRLESEAHLRWQELKYMKKNKMKDIVKSMEAQLPPSYYSTQCR
jgi:hypothetical protein